MITDMMIYSCFVSINNYKGTFFNIFNEWMGVLFPPKNFKNFKIVEREILKVGEIGKK